VKFTVVLELLKVRNAFELMVRLRIGPVLGTVSLAPPLKEISTGTEKFPRLLFVPGCPPLSRDTDPVVWLFAFV
jgi:hypothetical protein